jgi:hypothetical protein
MPSCLPWHPRSKTALEALGLADQVLHVVALERVVDRDFAAASAGGLFAASARAVSPTRSISSSGS